MDKEIKKVKGGLMYVEMELGVNNPLRATIPKKHLHMLSYIKSKKYDKIERLIRDGSLSIDRDFMEGIHILIKDDIIGIFVKIFECNNINYYRMDINNLFYASVKNNSIMISNYLVKNHRIDAGWNKNISFITACSRGYSKMVKFLLGCETVDITAQGYKGLRMACENDYYSIVNLILKSNLLERTYPSQKCVNICMLNRNYDTLQCILNDEKSSQGLVYKEICEILNKTMDDRLLSIVGCSKNYAQVAKSERGNIYKKICKKLEIISRLK